MAQPVETNSLEVRWFETGPPPREVGAWLTGFDSVTTTLRTDLYLPLPDPAINLKLRGGGSGAVEVKRLLGSPGRHTFGAGVTGTLEQWYKWSFSLDHTPSLWAADRSGLWLPVEKSRVLYVLDGAERRALEGSATGTSVTAHVEVTEITAPSETAWTCGLEVAGAPDALEDAATALGADLFGEGFPLELSAAQSFGYGEWLRRLTSGTHPASDVLVPSNR